jgi:hypothetical protein
MDVLTTPRIEDPDGFYSELLDAHEGLSEAESHALNARLVLLLSNVVGDHDVLRKAFALAKKAGA